jgi:hypothetical protein
MDVLNELSRSWGRELDEGKRARPSACRCTRCTRCTRCSVPPPALLLRADAPAAANAATLRTREERKPRGLHTYGGATNGGAKPAKGKII